MNNFIKIARELPKIDLHLHLDGALRPATVIALAREMGIALPTEQPEALLPYLQVQENCTSLREYLEKFDFALQFLQSAASLTRAAYEVVAQAAAERCLYLEVRFAPQLHVQQGLTRTAAITAVTDGLRQGERDFGVLTRALIICMRHHPEDINLAVLEDAAACRAAGNSHVAAVDLAGDEAGYPPALFRNVFARARALELPATIHAGEAGGADNVREAIETLGAVRIGHGVRMREHADVMALVKQQRIPLELCPLSNLQTKAVRDWSDYPIRQYVAEGYLVTVNTDNPTVSGTSLTNEYRLLNEHFAFTPEEIAGLILNSVDAAFLEFTEKTALRAKFMQGFAEAGVRI